MTPYEFNVAKYELFRDVVNLEDYELKLRFCEANEFFNSGTVPPWAYVSTSKLSLAILTEEEISWYAVLISIESLNKCKSFELYPNLAFYF
jgi:hypothetical protein